jgi:hypothetical protein
MEICCTCEWIPGRPGFLHLHRVRSVVSFYRHGLGWTEPKEYLNRWNPSKNLRILEEEEVVLISVDWKQVLRELQGIDP